MRTRKQLALLAIVALACSTILVVDSDAAAASSLDFIDVPLSHWAAGAIQEAVTAGYVSGYPDGTFKPNAHITRAEFLTMLAGALKLPVGSSAGGTWYEPYVDVLKRANILDFSDFKGDWSSSKLWNTDLSRMEMVRLEVRAAFPDYTNPNYIASDASYMYKAASTGLISGTDGGALDPQGLSTRAQAVAVIQRVLAVKSGHSLPIDKRAIANAEIDLTGTNMKSMLGITPKPFPISFTWWNDPKIQITLDKAVVLDCDNPDLNPTNDWLDKFKVYVNQKPLATLNSHGYLIAYHFKYHIEKHSGSNPIGWEFNPQFSRPYIPTYSITAKAGEEFYADQFEVYPIKDGNLNVTHTTEGWLIFWFSKDSDYKSIDTAPQIQNGPEQEDFFLLNTTK